MFYLCSRESGKLKPMQPNVPYIEDPYANQEDEFTWYLESEVEFIFLLTWGFVAVWPFFFFFFFLLANMVVVTLGFPEEAFQRPSLIWGVSRESVVVVAVVLLPGSQPEQCDVSNPSWVSWFPPASVLPQCSRNHSWDPA